MSDLEPARLQLLKRQGTSIDRLARLNHSNQAERIRAVLVNLVNGGPRSVVWVKSRVDEAA